MKGHLSFRNEPFRLSCSSCRSGNHHAELGIYHFERYNIYHIKTKIIFNFPIRVSTMESPKCSEVHAPKMRVEV